jgi:hypothetical protein
MIAVRPVIEAVVALSFAWNIVSGLRTGLMIWGIGGILEVTSDRRTDPRGFWMYVLANAACSALMIYLIVHPSSGR